MHLFVHTQPTRNAHTPKLRKNTMNTIYNYVTGAPAVEEQAELKPSESDDEAAAEAKMRDAQATAVEAPAAPPSSSDSEGDDEDAALGRMVLAMGESAGTAAMTDEAVLMHMTCIVGREFALVRPVLRDRGVVVRATLSAGLATQVAVTVKLYRAGAAVVSDTDGQLLATVCDAECSICFHAESEPRSGCIAVGYETLALAVEFAAHRQAAANIATYRTSNLGVALANNGCDLCADVTSSSVADAIECYAKARAAVNHAAPPSEEDDEIGPDFTLPKAICRAKNRTAATVPATLSPGAATQAEVTITHYFSGGCTVYDADGRDMASAYWHEGQVCFVVNDGRRVSVGRALFAPAVELAVHMRAMTRSIAAGKRPSELCFDLAERGCSLADVPTDTTAAACVYHYVTARASLLASPSTRVAKTGAVPPAMIGEPGMIDMMLQLGDAFVLGDIVLRKDDCLSVLATLAQGAATQAKVTLMWTRQGINVAVCGDVRVATVSYMAHRIVFWESEEYNSWVWVTPQQTALAVELAVHKRLRVTNRAGGGQYYMVARLLAQGFNLADDVTDRTLDDTLEKYAKARAALNANQTMSDAAIAVCNEVGMADLPTAAPPNCIQIRFWQPDGKSTFVPVPVDQSAQASALAEHQISTMLSYKPPPRAPSDMSEVELRRFIEARHRVREHHVEMCAGGFDLYANMPTADTLVGILATYARVKARLPLSPTMPTDMFIAAVRPMYAARMADMFVFRNAIDDDDVRADKWLKLAGIDTAVDKVAQDVAALTITAAPPSTTVAFSRSAIHTVYVTVPPMEYALAEEFALLQRDLIFCGLPPTDIHVVKDRERVKDRHLMLFASGFDACAQIVTDETVCGIIEKYALAVTMYPREPSMGPSAVMQEYIRAHKVARFEAGMAAADARVRDAQVQLFAADMDKREETAALVDNIKAGVATPEAQAALRAGYKAALAAHVPAAPVEDIKAGEIIMAYPATVAQPHNMSLYSHEIIVGSREFRNHLRALEAHGLTDSSDYKAAVAALEAHDRAEAAPKPHEVKVPTRADVKAGIERAKRARMESGTDERRSAIRAVVARELTRVSDDPDADAFTFSAATDGLTEADDVYADYILSLIAEFRAVKGTDGKGWYVYARL
jgi:hypothetical protein